MLKLEKARNQEVTVTFRKRERLFSSTFLYALSMALGLHLFAALIFQIHTYLHTNDKVFSPVTVEIDRAGLASDGNNGAVASIDESYSSSNDELAPKASSPTLSMLSTVPAVHHIDYIKESNSQHNPFGAIEDDLQYLFFQKESEQLPVIQVHVGGVLAEIPVIKDGVGPELIRILSAKGLTQQRLSYAVQVEGKTGRIFWHMPMSAIEKSELGDAAEQILNEMRFQKDDDIFIAAGEIEIEFRLSKVIQ